MYLLDTNIVSHWMRGHPEVLRRVRSHAPSELSLSSTTLAEILYGIEKSPSRKGERRDRITSILSQLQLHPFDEAAARRYARVRATSRRADSRSANGTPRSRPWLSPAG